MRSFLPSVFRPNRQRRPEPLTANSLRGHVAGLRVALGDAARQNLEALLVERPPIALPADLFRPLFDDADGDPLAGYELADWRAGQLPGADFVLRLIREPARAAAIASPRSGPGAEILLLRILYMAWADGALRHDLAQSCRQFLCDRVLFHPGPPPQALFSTVAMAELCLLQPGQTLSVTGRVATVLQLALRQVRAASRVSPPWDQWLYRRMKETTGWHLRDDLAILPWVAWRRGDPLPAGDAGLPDYWPELIDPDF